MDRPRVVIIGTGTAGYASALALAKETKGELDVVMIGADGGNSAMSHWNLNMDPDKENLLSGLIANLGPEPSFANPQHASYEARKKLLEYFVQNRDAAVHGLMRELDIPVRELGVEIKPVKNLPAPEIFRKFREKLEGTNTTIIKADVTGFALTDSGARITYEVNKDGQKEQETIDADRVIIASGGISHMYPNTTGQRNRKYPNILRMAESAGVELENMEKLFCHPCLIDNNSHGRRIVGLISPAFTAKAEFILENPDGTRQENFLPPQYVESLKNSTYLQNAAEIAHLFSRYKGRGNKIIMRTHMTQDEFENFCANDSYGWMFRGIHSVENIRELNVGPGVHYTMGGVQVNENCQSTSHQQVYAMGEAMSLYGNARPRGFGHIDSIILAPHMAKCLVSDLKRNHLLPADSGVNGRARGGEAGPMGRDAILRDGPQRHAQHTDE